MATVTSFLALARGLVGILTFEIAAVPADNEVVDLSIYADMTCDDDEPMLDEDGNIRGDCTRDGCGINDEVCYFEDYFDACLDNYGRPTGRCQTVQLACVGVLACAALWLDCGGQYQCNDPEIIGCQEGSCDEKDE